jgi:hypothetical protein
LFYRDGSDDSFYSPTYIKDVLTENDQSLDKGWKTIGCKITSEGGGKITFYIDGRKAGVISSPMTFLNVSADIRVGNLIAGKIAEACFFKRELTDEEFSKFSTEMYLAKDSDPVGLWLQEKTSTSWIDESGFSAGIPVTATTVLVDPRQKRANLVIVSSSIYSVLPQDEIIHVTGTGAAAVTVILPEANLSEGRIITIKDASGNATSNTLTINSAGGNIDGESERDIVTDYASDTFYSDGSNWFVI